MKLTKDDILEDIVPENKGDKYSYIIITNED